MEGALEGALLPISCHPHCLKSIALLLQAKRLRTNFELTFLCKHLPSQPHFPLFSPTDTHRYTFSPNQATANTPVISIRKLPPSLSALRSAQDVASELAYLTGRLNETDVYAPEAVPVQYNVEGDPESGLVVLPKSAQIANLGRKYRKVKAELDEVKAKAMAEVKAAEATVADTAIEEMTKSEETLQTTNQEEIPETTKTEETLESTNLSDTLGTTTTGETPETTTPKETLEKANLKEILETTATEETPETTATNVALETTALQITAGALPTKARKVAFQEPSDDGNPIS